MTGAFGNAFLSVLIISVISLVGVLALWMREKTLKKVVIYFVGFSAGALLGDVFLHLLPEAAEDGFGLLLGLYILLGILFSFVMEKLIHWHHCHNMDCPDQHHRKSALPYMNLFGDGIHNFLDGILIAGSYLVSVPVGVATTVAVILHEIPQELGDFGVLIHSGFKKGKALLFNFFSAALAFLGVIIVWLINVEGFRTFLVPFTAGTFLYIGGSDLIPELHAEVPSWKSVFQLFVFVLGIAVMAILLLLE